MSAIVATIAGINPVLLVITAGAVAGCALTLFAEWAAKREAQRFERDAANMTAPWSWDGDE